MNEPDDLAERIRSGASMEALLFSLLPPPHRGALRRCAAQRSFDPSMYDRVLRGRDGPAFDELVRAGHLELAPGEDHRYRVVAGLQSPAFDDWWLREDLKTGEPPVPKSLRALAADAVRDHQAHGRPVDQLDQLLLCDTQAAQKLFVELYDSTDARHDLPACQAILDVLESPYRLPLLDQSVLDHWHDRTCYLAARTLWAAEYHQSARYLARHRLEKVLDQLLDGRDGRLLQLYGQGGMGKTMQLRWFVARRCVPAPNRIPCARIDFDAVAASTAARHPWLLLVEIAAQLDRQFTYGLYQDLLTTYGPYRALLYRSGRRSGSVEPPVKAVDIDGEDIRARFTSGLVERAANRPVVVVLDTVEELLQRLGDEPTGLLRLLKRLHDDVPALRVVFASRVASPERLLPGLRSVPIESFDDDEQRRYLRDIRKVDDPKLIDAIVAKTRGTPFTLAVYADLVHKEPDITPQEILEIEDPGVQYAIERVVKRIGDDQIRWLLRYGVVPRTLTFRFVTDVMAPFLASGLEGGSPDDDPHRDRRSTEVWLQHRTRAPRTEAEFRDLWQRLINYASAYSWVWVIAGEEDAVCFHPVVREPLRNLVRSQPVYRRLNLAAARHYERLAADPASGKWAELMCEAVYHSFQADPAAAVAIWRRALDQARAAGRPDWTQRLTEELLGSDYRDRSGALHEGITPQLLVEAYLEHGRAAADLAAQRQVPGEESKEDTLWSDAEAALRKAQALARSPESEAELPQPAATVLEGRLLIAQGRADKAEALLRERQEQLQPSAELADLEQALGDALQRLRRVEAASHYRQAYRLAMKAGDQPGARSAIVSLASERVLQGRADEALRWLDTATADGAVEPDDEDAVFLRALALGAAGVPDQGARQLRAFLQERPGASSFVTFLLGWLLLQAGRHDQAVEAATRSLGELAQKPDPTVDVTAETLWIRGLASGRLLDFATAVDDLLAAASRSRDLRDLDAAAEYAAAAAAVQLLRMGDLRSAAQSVDEADRASGQPGGEGWAAVLVTQARLRDRTGQPETARALIDGARPVLTAERSGPDTCIQVAIGGLSLRMPTTDDLAMLVDQLKYVYPPTARLMFLSELREVRSLPDDAPPELRQAFAEVALNGRRAGGSVPEPEPGERARLNLTAAEVLRLVGRTDEALDLLDEAVRLRGDDLMWWHWLEARRRVDPAHAGGPRPPEWLAIGDRYPVLGAAYLVRLAEYRLQLDGLERAGERLDRADRLLRRSLRPHRWTARLLEAKARLAQLHGDGETAARLAASAARTWGVLGDVRRRAMLGGQYRLGEPTATPDVQRLELQLSWITMAGSRGQPEIPAAHVVARLPDGSKPEQRLPTTDLGDLAGGLLGGRVLARVRSVVERFVEDERRWELEAGRLIPADARRLLAGAGDGRSLDVRMVAEQRELGALPWELVRLPEAPDRALVDLPGVATLYRTLPLGPRDENKIRALQELLARLELYDGVADGLMGEVTVASLRRFQRRAGLPVDGVPGRATWDALRGEVARGRERPVRVLVIHPDRGKELVRRRGPSAGGTDLVQVYRRYGARVWSLKDPTLEQLRVYGDRLRDEPPDVIHVAGTVTLSAGATVLDFGGDAATRTVVKGMVRADQLPVTALSDLVAALDNAPYGPTVLLDVAAPQTRAETVRALLVRNSLAHQLLRLGHAVAVIATGLAAPGHQDDLCDLLAGGITEHNDPATLVRRVRSALLPRGTFETDLPFLGSALYVHRSPYTLLPLGVS